MVLMHWCFLSTRGPLTTSAAVKQTMLVDYGSRDQLFLEVVADIRARLLKIAGVSKELPVHTSTAHGWASEKGGLWGKGSFQKGPENLPPPERSRETRDLRESIRRFARIAWFSRIVSGFPNRTPFLRIALRGAENCKSQVWGDSRESLARYENRGFSANRCMRIDSRESPRFALQKAGPSKSRL